MSYLEVCAERTDDKCDVTSVELMASLRDADWRKRCYQSFPPVSPPNKSADWSCANNDQTRTHNAAFVKVYVWDLEIDEAAGVDRKGEDCILGEDNNWVLNIFALTW